MTQKQRTIGALLILLAVAGTSYAFLEWQGLPVPDPEPRAVTSSPEATPEPEEEPAPEPTSTNHDYGTATIGLNEIASFPNGLSLRVTSILEDSRCPEDARCIQAGTVRLSVRIRSSMGVSTNEFTLGTAITTEAEEITLLNVSPGKNTNTTLTDSDYRFTFDVKQRTAPAGKCYVGGCSQQLCTDDPMAASTCEYRSEYACYKTATCERQPTGECGWTQSSELKKCLANPPDVED